jgi:hypothetical protein
MASLCAIVHPRAFGRVGSRYTCVSRSHTLTRDPEQVTTASYDVDDKLSYIESSVGKLSDEPMVRHISGRAFS